MLPRVLFSSNVLWFCSLSFLFNFKFSIFKLGIKAIKQQKYFRMQDQGQSDVMGESPNQEKHAEDSKWKTDSRWNLQFPETWREQIWVGAQAPLHYCLSQFSSVQSLSRVWLFATPWTAACQASLSITKAWNLLKLRSTGSVMPSNNFIFCLLFLLPPSIFSNESVLHIRWPKYWHFSFNISLSNEYSGLISFRMDWLNILAVQGTLESLQDHSSKASILCHSVFFIVQLSHPYMTTGKSIALTIHAFFLAMWCFCF